MFHRRHIVVGSKIRQVLFAAVIFIIIITSIGFPFPWCAFFSTDGAPHHSVFRFKIVALIMCCIISIAVFVRR